MTKKLPSYDTIRADMGVLLDKILGGAISADDAMAAARTASVILHNERLHMEYAKAKGTVPTSSYFKPVRGRG